ncbi:MAG: PSD1 and planctomycete cytochrome C domain-containing protein [Bryobacteraceae bacterium]
MTLDLRRIVRRIWPAAVAACHCLAYSPPAVDFRKQIEPLFKERCHACHAGAKQLGGLRLDSREAAIAGGYSGAVIKPGNAVASKLIALIDGKAKEKSMPLGGPRLTAGQVALVRDWIDQGAHWPASAATGSMVKPKTTHWAFVRPVRPPLPRVHDARWVRKPIDAFVVARLEAEGIPPSPEADRSTLIRRASLDLTGLPPTPDEVAAFVSDPRQDAYEHLVERLLRSEHYGEKWARHWLDLARYADSDGFEKDNVRPDAWKWRDWVIRAINSGMPFDRFTIEQMAGDLLPNATLAQKIATGFHRNTLTNREGGVNREEYRVEQVIDRASTVGTVWLGLTVGCARCHDHKYDPISQREFYQLTAFFNSADEANIEAPLPGELAAYLQRQPDCEARRRALLAEYKVADLQPDWERKMLLAAGQPGADTFYDVSWDIFGLYVDGGQEQLRIPASQRSAKWNAKITDFFIGNYSRVAAKAELDRLKFKDLNEKLRQLKAGCQDLSEAQTLAERPQPRKSHILIRGDFRQPGIEVQPGGLAVLNPMPAEQRPSRLTLAKWLVSRDNPLTARVTVNRAWQEFFGRGLVATSEDFGARAEPPTHPALLDWLATEFMEGGWEMKKLHRLIVTSATYRQSSKARPELTARDPGNSLLARQQRLRLSAELIRDATLSAAGLINLEIGGPSARPSMPPGVLDLAYGSSSKWKESTGAERHRRGLYTLFLRTAPHPQMTNFDAPDSMVACSRRERSTTPLQALNLLNDSSFFEAAQLLAVRIVRSESRSVEDRLRFAFRVSLAREPRAEELDRMVRFYRQQVEILEKDPSLVESIFPARDLDGIAPTEAAPWVGVGRLLLNLDEFITRG